MRKEGSVTYGQAANISYGCLTCARPNWSKRSGGRNRKAHLHDTTLSNSAKVPSLHFGQTFGPFNRNCTDTKRISDWIFTGSVNQVDCLSFIIRPRFCLSLRQKLAKQLDNNEMMT